MKSVLFITDSLNIGGTTTGLITLLRYMDKSKYAITLMVLDNTMMPEEIEGVKCIGYTTNKNERSLIQRILKGHCLVDYFLYKMYKDTPLFRSIIMRRYGVDVVYNRLPISQNIVSKTVCLMTDMPQEYDVAISWMEMLPNYYLARKVHAKVKVGFIHPGYKGAGFSIVADSRHLPKLNCLCVVSEENKKTLGTIFPEIPISVIENMIPDEDIIKRSHEEDINISDDSVVFVSVSRLDNVSKALDRTLHVLKTLKNEGLKYKWYIVGDGPDKGALESIIRHENLCQEIFLLGKRKNPYPIMKQADVFLMLSRYEGRPVAVEEAKTLGIKILATNYSSAYEQINSSEYGWVVDNEEKAIENKLRELILSGKVNSRYNFKHDNDVILAKLYGLMEQ